MKYWVIGGDGREYGPEEANQIRVWIAEGRLDAGCRIKIEGENLWRALGDLPEFAGAPRPAPAAAAPAGSPAESAGSRVDAVRRVRGPALALALNGVLALGISILDIALRILVRTGALRLEDYLPAAPPGFEQIMEQAKQGMADPLGLALGFIAIVANGLVIFGALKMKHLQFYGLAITISILSAIPCQCCCVLGLPFGIWALMVLNRPDVKSQFS